METKKIIAIVLILGLLALGTLAIAAPMVSAAPITSGSATSWSVCKDYTPGDIMGGEPEWAMCIPGY